MIGSRMSADTSANFEGNSFSRFTLRFGVRHVGTGHLWGYTPDYYSMASVLLSCYGCWISLNVHKTSGSRLSHSYIAVTAFFRMGGRLIPPNKYLSHNLLHWCTISICVSLCNAYVCVTTPTYSLYPRHYVYILFISVSLRLRTVYICVTTSTYCIYLRHYVYILFISVSLCLHTVYIRVTTSTYCLYLCHYIYILYISVSLRLHCAILSRYYL